MHRPIIFDRKTTTRNKMQFGADPVRYDMATMDDDDDWFRSYGRSISVPQPSKKLMRARQQIEQQRQRMWRRLCLAVLALVVVSIVVLVCVFVFFSESYTQTVPWSARTDVVPSQASFVWTLAGSNAVPSRLLLDRTQRQARVEYLGNEETRHVLWWDFANCTQYQLDVFLTGTYFCEVTPIPAAQCQAYATRPVSSRANVVEITENLSANDDTSATHERIVDKIELDSDTLAFRESANQRLLRYIRDNRIYPVVDWRTGANSLQMGVPLETVHTYCHHAPEPSTNTLLPSMMRFWLLSSMRSRCPRTAAVTLDDALNGLEWGFGYGNWCDGVFRTVALAPARRCNTTVCNDGGVDNACRTALAGLHRRLLMPSLPIASCYVQQQALRMLNDTRSSAADCTGTCDRTRALLQVLWMCLPCDAQTVKMVVVPDWPRAYISPVTTRVARWDMRSLGNDVAPLLPFNSSQPFPTNEFNWTWAPFDYAHWILHRFG